MDDKKDHFTNLVVAGLSGISSDEKDSLILSALKEYLADTKNWSRTTQKAVDEVIAMEAKELLKTEEMKELLATHVMQASKSYIHKFSIKADGRW